MNPTLKKVLLLVILAGVNFGPAWNLTMAELADKYDASETTRFQPELLITAWGEAFKAALIALAVWFNRNVLVENKIEELNR